MADGVFKGKYPSIRFTADVDSIKPQALHLTTQAIIYHGKMEGDFTNLDPSNLNGDLLITNSVLVTNGERTQLDSIRLFADEFRNGQQLIRVQSQFLCSRNTGEIQAYTTG